MVICNPGLQDRLVIIIVIVNYFYDGGGEVGKEGMVEGEREERRRRRGDKTKREGKICRIVERVYNCGLVDRSYIRCYNEMFVIWAHVVNIIVNKCFTCRC